MKKSERGFWNLATNQRMDLTHASVAKNQRNTLCGGYREINPNQIICSVLNVKKG